MYPDPEAEGLAKGGNRSSGSGSGGGGNGLDACRNRGLLERSSASSDSAIASCKEISTRAVQSTLVLAFL